MSRYDFNAQRLFVDADLAEGRMVACTPAQANYLRNVLRLGPGDPILAFNGRDGEWRAEVADAGRRATALAVRAQTRAQEGGPDIDYLFAPLKRARLDYMVEKATEMGVARLRPVRTRRTVADRVNLERMRAHAIEAAEQSERLSVPTIREALNLHGVLAQWPSERRLLACVEAGTAKPIAEVLSAAKQEPPSNHGAWAILVGPAGGFTRSELDALHKLPFVTPVGLGPRILRADTAALAALACWQAILGDGQQRPLDR